MAGTIIYENPEILNGLPYNKKSDIWALGVILYDLLTFKNPFMSFSQIEMINNITQGIYPLINDNYYSKDIIHLCYSILKVDPSERPEIDYILNELKRIKKKRNNNNILNNNNFNEKRNLNEKLNSNTNYEIMNQSKYNNKNNKNDNYKFYGNYYKILNRNESNDVNNRKNNLNNQDLNCRFNDNNKNPNNSFQNLFYDDDNTLIQNQNYLNTFSNGFMEPNFEN